MKCRNCGKETSESRLYCGWCGAEIRKLTEVQEEPTETQEESLSTQPTRSEKWERTLSRGGDFASDDRGGVEDAADRDGVAQEDRWKLHLLPILAVIAMLLVLTGTLLQEIAISESEHAETFGDLLKATKDANNAYRALEVGIVMLALVVAGISIEYRRL